MLKSLKYFTACFFQHITDIVMFFPFFFIRKLFLYPFLKKTGKGWFIGRNCDIRFPFRIHIGQNAVVNKHCVLDGRGGEIFIGDNVDIAQETNIWTLEHDVNDNGHAPKKGDVHIDHHAWIASRATILPGVNIGYGAVVASGAVVTKDVEPMMIVGGVPAKVIGNRKNECEYNLHYHPFFQ